MGNFQPTAENLATFKGSSPELNLILDDPNFLASRENVLGLVADLQAEADRLQAFARNPSFKQVLQGCCCLSCLCASGGDPR